jgi:hypothetical protein
LIDHAASEHTQPCHANKNERQSQEVPMNPFISTSSCILA